MTQRRAGLERICFATLKSKEMFKLYLHTSVGTRLIRIHSIERPESGFNEFYEVKQRLNNTSQEYSVAYESYISAILGGQFQLGVIIHEESWDKRVYAVQPLMSPGWKLEATAFRFQGLPRKLLESRKRQLGRLRAQSLCQIDQAGMKFVVHEPRDLGESSSSAQSRVSKFVLDPFQFPKLKFANDFMSPAATTGDSWAQVAAQDRQPTISNDRPEEISASKFLRLMNEGNPTKGTHAHLNGGNEHAGTRVRRKRRHGKSKVSQKLCPTHVQAAPQDPQFLGLGAQTDTERVLYDPHEAMSCALERLFASIYLMMESRLDTLRWLRWRRTWTRLKQKCFYFHWKPMPKEPEVT